MQDNILNYYRSGLWTDSKEYCKRYYFSRWLSYALFETSPKYLRLLFSRFLDRTYGTKMAYMVYILLIFYTCNILINNILLIFLNEELF